MDVCLSCTIRVVPTRLASVNFTHVWSRTTAGGKVRVCLEATTRAVLRQLGRVYFVRAGGRIIAGR